MTSAAVGLAVGLSILVSSVFAGGCGGGEEAPAGPGPIPIEALRAELGEATCAFDVRCGTMPNVDTCQRIERSDDDLLQLLADVVYGRVTYDPAAARACVEARRARTCESLASETARLDGACRGMFKGSIAPGQPCVTDLECASEGRCDRSTCTDDAACCLGACTEAVVRVPVGGDCSEESCVDDAYCEGESEGEGGGGGSPPARLCKARLDNGDACRQSDACKDGQRCAVNGDSGKCYILAKEGESCNPGLDVACLSFDTWCDPAASKCVKLPGAGQPCAKGNACLGYAYCDGMSCKQRPVEGEACPKDGPRCLGDLGCDAEVCAKPKTTIVCAPIDGNE